MGKEASLLVVVALAGFAAGWFTREAMPMEETAPLPSVVSTPPAPAPVAPPKPAFDPMSLVSTDRAAAVAWWAGADASPKRNEVEQALALPAGVGFFDYLPPIYDRAAPDLPLGFFAGRAKDGKTCLYLAAKVPRAQGGLRLGRDCDELTIDSPRWLAMRVGTRYALVDAKARRIVSTADEPPSDAPTFLFGVTKEGLASERTSSATLVRSGEVDVAMAREVSVPDDLGDLATSDVRPMQVTREPSDEDDRDRAIAAVNRLYLHADDDADAGAPDCQVMSVERVSSPWLAFAIARVQLACIGGAEVALLPMSDAPQALAFASLESTTLALPGSSGGFVTFDAAPDGKGGALHLVACDRSRCAAQDASVDGE